MNKYLLFCWDQYYPCGGFNDFVGTFDTYEEAIKEAAFQQRDHYEITKMSYDETTGDIKFDS